MTTALPVTRALTIIALSAIWAKDVAAADYGERLRFFRWSEDYRTLTDHQAGFGAMKRIPLSDRAFPYLTLGGDYRFRFEHHSNQSFGLRGDFETDSALHRFMPIAPIASQFIFQSPASESSGQNIRGHWRREWP